MRISLLRISLLRISLLQFFKTITKNLPDAIFIGGGLSNYEQEDSSSLLDLCWKLIKPGGRLVAHAVTFETEQQLLSWRKKNGGDLTRLSISRVDSIGKFYGWKPLRPVTQYSITKAY